ncbi:hypothetical protein PBY51_005646 [Eleginops maclovinus]|uniref:Uncharacterized protein n=1 Tax=Eleginops maclovinus TaxID=56733 RepID=A0AAN7X9L8_ELEMC|nr:hypothetical protein PBY51_005646 [Eleginops maclovinus]
MRLGARKRGGMRRLEVPIHIQLKNNRKYNISVSPEAVEFPSSLGYRRSNDRNLLMMCWTKRSERTWF